MGSPRTAGPRVGVIIALRPDLAVDSERRRVDLAKTGVDASEELGDRPYQLSLFDPSLFDGVPER